jgi:hypothetical protein
MALSTQDALAAKRAAYREEGCWQRFLLDSYTGCGGYMGKVKQPPAGYWGSAADQYREFSWDRAGDFVRNDESDTYLDRFPREDFEKFGRRKAVAHYTNYCRPITNLLVSYIVKKPFDRILPQKIADWVERTNYDSGFRKRALTCAVLGWFPVLVDKAAVDPDARSAADTGAPEPYIAERLPCQMTDYQLNEAGEFEWVKFETSEVVKRAWNDDAVKVTKYALWDARGWATFESVDGADARQTGTGTHDFGRVPVVSWRAAASVEDHVKAASIIADVAVEGRRLFNLTSELDEHIRGQVFALLAVPQRTPAANAESPDLGVENGLLFDPDTKHLPQFIAPPSTVAATLETRMTNSIIEIYRIARVEYDRASGTTSSAQSKQANFEQTNALLCDFADALAEADYETLYLVGVGLGCSESELATLSVTAHSSYATDDLTVELQQTIDACTLVDFGDEAKKLIMKRAVRQLIPNMTADQQKAVDADIDETIEQAAKDAEAMAQAAADALDTSAEAGDGTDAPAEDDPADGGRREPAG